MADEKKPIRNHLISRRKFRDFVASHPGAAKDMGTLMTFCRHIERTHWRNFNEVRATFPHADKIGDFVCFNVCGNTYRVIAKIRHRELTATDVLIHLVMTHPEYDQWSKGQ